MDGWMDVPHSCEDEERKGESRSRDLADEEKRKQEKKGRNLKTKPSCPLCL
jgi:hypothetical protein